MKVKDIAYEIADTLGCGLCVARDDCLEDKPFKDCPHSEILPRLVRIVEAGWKDAQVH